MGFVLASGTLLIRAADTTLVAYAVSAATAMLMLRTRLHPLLIMAAAAAVGMAGWL